MKKFLHLVVHLVATLPTAMCKITYY